MALESSNQNLITVVNDKKFEDFGYLIIRTIYGDDASYEKWSEQFGNLIEKSLVERGEAMEEMLNKLMTAMVAEDVLHRASWKKIQECVCHHPPRISQSGDESPLSFLILKSKTSKDADRVVRNEL